MICLEKLDTPVPQRGRLPDGERLANPRLFRNECRAPMNNVAEPGVHATQPPAKMCDASGQRLLLPAANPEQSVRMLAATPNRTARSGSKEAIGWTGRSMMRWRLATRQSGRPP